MLNIIYPDNALICLLGIMQWHVPLSFYQEKNECSFYWFANKVWQLRQKCTDFNTTCFNDKFQFLIHSRNHRQWPEQKQITHAYTNALSDFLLTITINFLRAKSIETKFTLASLYNFQWSTIDLALRTFILHKYFQAHDFDIWIMWASIPLYWLIASII